MRILYVADDLYPGFGGQARASEGHIAALRERGHELAALAGREPHPTAAPEGVRVVRLPSWQPGKTQTRFTHPIVTIIAAEVAQADIVHANTPGPLTAVTRVLAARYGVPVVMGVHTQLETSSLQMPLAAALIERLLSVWYRWLFSSADLLVAPTSFAADTARAFSSGRVEVVSNGIDVSTWPTPAVKTRGRHRKLAYLGRLSAEKHPFDLLTLMENLPEETALVIAGSGPLEERLREEIGSRGLEKRVSMTGFISEEEKRELLYDTELFLMPSPAELQSIATLEAMAAGCAVAVVGHASSAVPALVTEARGGVVLAVDDAATQAKQLLALLDDGEALQAAQSNARRYAELHDVRRSATRLERLYLELLPAGTTRRPAAESAAIEPTPVEGEGQR